MQMNEEAERQNNPKKIVEAILDPSPLTLAHVVMLEKISSPLLYGDTSSTEKNLQLRRDAENGACAGKLELAKRAKELGYDAIHDTVHEMAKDEARHGCGFAGLLKRYFGK